jgi:hypothetical protein
VSDRPEPGQTYRHHRGNLYKCLMLATHSESLDEMVIYQRLDNGQVWARPMSVWTQRVDMHNRIDRFVLVKPDLGAAEVD